MTHVVNAGSQDHGSHFQVCQVVSKGIIGQETAQRLGDVRSMNIVMVWVVCVVRSFYVLQMTVSNKLTLDSTETSGML